MAGHSHWKQIKEQKGRADVKRAQLFSKLLASIAVAARSEANPEFNPRLRSAVEEARMRQVPQANIERAIARASDAIKLEEVVVEAYGPEKTALIIEAITDNKNRTIAELERILAEHDAKMATPGSVFWLFDRKGADWTPKFKQVISPGGEERIRALIETLEAHRDVERITTNL